VGSLRNKLLFLLPAALALSLLAPWAVTPLLMLGGAYLCYEGTEKVYEAAASHRAHADAAGPSPALDAKSFEDRKVASAIKTDFILSAEIMAITLAAVPEGNLVIQALVLALVGTGITAVVYGAVALIVKADDVGLALIASVSSTGLGRLGRALGRVLVLGMPVLLKILSIVGTAAMIWVGGGILVHGLEGYGLPAIGHTIHHAAEVASHGFPQGGGVVAWAVGAFGSGLIGLLIGAALIPVTSFVLVPVFRTWTARQAG
jgi:predicted DNA repair protein MutK